MKKLVILAAVVALTGCATGYQPKGGTGGFDQTQLSSTRYQVRYRGNGFETPERVSQFILRRAAEITLEQGGRWFTVADQQAVTSANGSMGFVASFPSGAAVVTLLPAEAPNAIDAVIVIRETDAAAKGKLSPTARRRLAELQ